MNNTLNIQIDYFYKILESYKYALDLSERQTSTMELIKVLITELKLKDKSDNNTVKALIIEKDLKQPTLPKVTDLNSELIHLSMRDNVNDGHCGYLNKLQNEAHYYQIDGKLKFLQYESKEEYDKLTKDINSLNEITFCSERVSLQSKLVDQRKGLLK